MGGVANDGGSGGKRAPGAGERQRVADALAGRREFFGRPAAAPGQQRCQRAVVNSLDSIDDFGEIDQHHAQALVGLGQKRQRSAAGKALEGRVARPAGAVHIEHQGRLVVAAGGAGNAGQATGQRTAAVGANQQLAGQPSAAFKQYFNMIGRLPNVFEALRAQGFNLIACIKTAQQGGAQFAGHDDGAKARVAEVSGVEGQVAGCAGAAYFDAPEGLGMQRIVQHVEVAENIERGGVDHQRAVIKAGAAVRAGLKGLDQGNSAPGLRKADGQRRTGQAAADDDDVKVAHDCMTASIFSGSDGTASVRFSGSPSVTRMSSSMRMPMLRKCAGMSSPSSMYSPGSTVTTMFFSSTRDCPSMR